MSVALAGAIAGILGVAVLASYWALAGWLGISYLGLVLLTGLPGLPLGSALFGRRHLAAWITGLPVGYALTTFAWWAVIAAGVPSTASFVCSWAAVSAASWAIARRRTAPLVVLPPWTRRDTAALCLVLLLVPMLVTRPFTQIGSKDDQGYQRYRAYFTADFVWHTALAAELAKHEPRPRNPFMAAEPLHYYWTYFRIPASVAAQSNADIQTILKLNAASTAFIFLAAIYLAAWAAVPGWPLIVAAAVALTLLCPSAEGLASIVELLRRGDSLRELRNLNIDAVASWAFKGVRIDNLPRAMWYNPQHSFSCALGLLTIPVALWGGARPRRGAIVCVGTALGASLAFNPLLGASFAAIYGITVLILTLRNDGTFRDLLEHLWALPPVGLALLWCLFNDVGDGAGDTLILGLWGSARNATFLNLALQLGPLLFLLATGVWPNKTVPFTTVWPAITGVVLGLVLMHFVTLHASPAWVGFRGGQVLLVMAPALVARALTYLWQAHRRRWSVAAAAVAIVGGFPTSVIDLYNAQDVTNRGLSPGAEFHWTLVVSPQEQQALQWIRTMTPEDAVVQADPTARARETWSYIPTFAERRMATGTPISLLPEPAAEGMNERVKAVYASDDPAFAWREAVNMGIDYLYVGVVERAAYPATQKFRNQPARFERVFSNEEAEVYAVRQ